MRAPAPDTWSDPMSLVSLNGRLPMKDRSVIQIGPFPSLSEYLCRGPDDILARSDAGCLVGGNQSDKSAGASAGPRRDGGDVVAEPYGGDARGPDEGGRGPRWRS